MALRKGRRHMADGRRRGKEKQITKNDLAY
jgi:hypothetical protein